MFTLKKVLWAGSIGVTLALPFLVAGCGGDSGRPGAPGGTAPTASTEASGGVTTASPGGANVGPDEGTGAGVR